MSLDDLTLAEEEALKRELARLRSPAWRAWKTTKRVVGVIISLYSLNASIQTYRLITDDAFLARKQMLKSFYAVARHLSDDRTFILINSAYIKIKRLVNDDFEQDMRHYKHYKRASDATEQEFKKGVERIYNPFVMLK